MSQAETDPIRRLYPDTDCPDNHVELSRDTLSWLAQQGEDANAVIQLERLRRSYAQEWLRLCAATEDRFEHTVIRTLIVEGGTVTSHDLKSTTGASMRTVRRRLNELEADDLITVSNGRPPTVSFANESVALLAQDTLSFYYNTTVNNTSTLHFQSNAMGDSNTPLNGQTVSGYGSGGSP